MPYSLLTRKDNVKIMWGEDAKLLAFSIILAMVAFSGSLYVYASGETPTLSVAVQQSLTTVISTDNFANLTPGTPVTATSTLSIDTNNSSGWYVTLSGDNKTAANNVLNDGGSNEIPDPTNEWKVLAATATTTGGNAATITWGDNFLYFRVMSASGTASFLSTAWWGSDDTTANAKWAGIASSTNVSRIGDSSVSSGGSTAVNTVLFYADVAASQPTGTYTGALTYTVTGN